MAAMADPAWIAEARGKNLGLDGLDGESLQAIVAAAVATPRDLLDQTRRYIGQ